MLAVFTGLALVFAARKYTQAVKDDIGDKSVFTCALSLFLDRILISLKAFVGGEKCHLVCVQIN